jgi:CRISPR system Cascade subunit CasE
VAAKEHMIWLSKLPLNLRSSKVQLDLRDPSQMYRTLERGFGSPSGLDAARCLFRVDVSPHGGQVGVLVQSGAQPNWSSLESMAGYLTGPALSKPFDPQFAVGDELAFRLVANPAVKRGGKRVSLYGEEEAREWIHRKSEEGGFSLTSVVAQPAEKIRCTTPRGQSTTLSSVRFEGVLRVVDPARLAEAVRGGIGSGKGFGFGLLSLAPG